MNSENGEAQGILHSLPAVDRLLKGQRGASICAAYGRDLAVYAFRRAVAHARKAVREGAAPRAADVIVDDAERIAQSIVAQSPRRVINATGVILHTNLGRAPLGDAVIADISAAARGYCTIEFDLATGKRGSRNDHVRELIRYLTGAGDAVVVNNNAAALVLILATLARCREVIVSRGELIEIGGEFRIPDIMKASGAKMVEVGTTNRTRLSDYEKAVGPKTALLFKAHKSNFAIRGFAEEATVKELAGLARRRGLVMVYDIGSGLLRRSETPALSCEPDVRSAVADGADLVTFSCDKLLGGPQGGIIAGAAGLVAKLATAPLMRALRAGKLTLSALSGACRRHLSEEAHAAGNPTFAMIRQTEDTVRARAEKLRRLIENNGIGCSLIESAAQAGGGSLPDVSLKSSSVTLTPPGGTSKQRERFAERAYHKLLACDPPVVTVLREGRLELDCFTILDDEIEMAAGAVARCSEALI